MRAWTVLGRVLMPATAFLACLVVGEIGLAWRDLQSGPGLDQEFKKAAPTGSVDVAAAEDPVARILARPLFTPGRHGAAEARAPEAAPTPKPSEPPRLLGLLISGSKRFAWFDDPNADNPTMVSEGDDIGDFTVESIGRRSLVLSDAKGEDHEVFPRALAAPSGPTNPQQARAPADGAPDEQKDDDDKDDDDEPAAPAAAKP